jgi:hypothetical protein
MILFADGRQFQIAGTVLSDGSTIIPFSAISLGGRPTDFPIRVAGVLPPIMYVELVIVGDGTFLAAMSTADYNILALAQQRPVVQPQSFLQQAARVIGARCGACGQR